MIGKLFCFVFWRKTGLNTNGDVFFKIKVFPFQSGKKAMSRLSLEALLFGNAGLLDGEKDNYYKDLKSRFNYLSHKYQRERKVYSSKFSF
jgi:hypothetical protein